MLAHNQSGYVIFRLFLSRTITSSSFNFVPYMEVVSSPFLRRLQVKRVLRTKGWNSKYFTEYVTSSKEPWKRKFVKKWKQLSGNNLLVYLSLFLVVAVAAAVNLFCYLCVSDMFILEWVKYHAFAVFFWLVEGYPNIYIIFLYT